MSKRKMLEDVKTPVSYSDWQAKVDYLRQQARLATKEMKKAQQLEEIQLEEERKRQEIADALKIIEVIKSLRMKDGSSVYDWARKELIKNKAVVVEDERERTLSGTSKQSENISEKDNNGQG